MPASGILLLLLSGAAPSADETTVEQAIRKFQSDYYRAGVRDEDRVQAVAALAIHRDDKVARALAPFLTQGPVPVRIVVARHLAGFQGVDGVGENLLRALTHSRNTGEAGRGVQVTILRSLGTLKASYAAKAVDELIQNPDIWVSKAAIEAAGKIRSGSSVGHLIRVLERLDGPLGERDITLDLYEGALPATGTLQIIKREAETRDRGRKSQRQVLREPLLASLTSITKASFSGVKEWQQWWRSRRHGYVAPP